MRASPVTLRVRPPHVRPDAGDLLDMAAEAEGRADHVLATATAAHDRSYALGKSGRPVDADREADRASHLQQHAADLLAASRAIVSFIATP